jgi:hypothetical protein
VVLGFDVYGVIGRNMADLKACQITFLRAGGRVVTVKSGARLILVPKVRTLGEAMEIARQDTGRCSYPIEVERRLHLGRRDRWPIFHPIVRSPYLFSVIFFRTEWFSVD